MMTTIVDEEGKSLSKFGSKKSSGQHLHVVLYPSLELLPSVLLSLRPQDTLSYVDSIDCHLWLVVMVNRRQIFCLTLSLSHSLIVASYTNSLHLHDHLNLRSDERNIPITTFFFKMPLRCNAVKRKDYRIKEKTSFQERHIVFTCVFMWCLERVEVTGIPMWEDESD